MTTLEYTIEKGSIYEYQLELLRSGKCKALLPGSYYVEGDNIQILCETSGTISLPEMLKSRDLELLSGFRSMLKALRRIIEASQLAEGYMIDNTKLSFAAGDIYFDADDGRAKLLLKPGQQIFQALPVNLFSAKRKELLLLLIKIRHAHTSSRRTYWQRQCRKGL